MAVMAVDAGAPVAVKGSVWRRSRASAGRGDELGCSWSTAGCICGAVGGGSRREPIVERLGGDAGYQSMQQFADSPWDPALVVKAVAERVAPEIDVEAWVLDDTGFPKDGKDSPGVKRQYSGTLGKTGNCQIGVSVHAVGARGTVPLGWALYLPEDWCADEQRRQDEDPRGGRFQDQAGARGRVGRAAAGWNLPNAGARRSRLRREHVLRDRLDQAGCESCCRSGRPRVFAQGTVFAVPAKEGRIGRSQLPRTARPS